MVSDADRWLQRMRRLRVDRDALKGVAPHKPLLLLSVLDALEAGEITGEVVALSAGLVMRFQNFWPIVQARRGNRGDIRMPFHALGTDGIWSVEDEEGRPSRARPTSVRARLPADLQALLADPGFRLRLRRELVARYFLAGEAVALRVALGFDAGAGEAPRFEEETAGEAAARAAGRSARFKNLVVSGYQYTCVLTGYRLATVEQAGIVEAAHIHAFSSSHNDDPDNGLALTPTAHALFDLGLWTLSDEGRIWVKPRRDFEESTPPGGFSLRALDGLPARLTAARIQPSPRNLRWHRRKHGFE